MAHLHVSPILHSASSCFKKQKKSFSSRAGKVNAKLASEIGRVDEPLSLSNSS